MARASARIAALGSDAALTASVAVDRASPDRTSNRETLRVGAALRTSASFSRTPSHFPVRRTPCLSPMLFRPTVRPR